MVKSSGAAIRIVVALTSSILVTYLNYIVVVW